MKIGNAAWLPCQCNTLTCWSYSLWSTTRWDNILSLAPVMHFICWNRLIPTIDSNHFPCFHLHCIKILFEANCKQAPWLIFHIWVVLSQMKLLQIRNRICAYQMLLLCMHTLALQNSGFRGQNNHFGVWHKNHTFTCIHHQVWCKIQFIFTYWGEWKPNPGRANHNSSHPGKLHSQITDKYWAWFPLKIIIWLQQS